MRQSRPTAWEAEEVKEVWQCHLLNEQLSESSTRDSPAEARRRIGSLGEGGESTCLAYFEFRKLMIKREEQGASGRVKTYNNKICRFESLKVCKQIPK